MAARRENQSAPGNESKNMAVRTRDNALTTSTLGSIPNLANDRRRVGPNTNAGVQDHRAGSGGGDRNG